MQLKDFETLEAARAYEVTSHRLVSREVMISLLVGAGILIDLRSMAETAGPFQNAMAGFFDSGIREYNFNEAHPVGAGNVALLDAMIGAGLPVSAALAALRPQLIALSTVTSKPFESVTLHSYLTAKGTCPKKQVTPQSGWLRITTNADTEPHSPTLWHQPFEGHFVRVGNMPVIESAGEYILKVSLAYPVLFVDDAYGVI